MKLHHSEARTPLDHALDDFVPLDNPCENLVDDFLEKGLGVWCRERTSAARREDGYDGRKPTSVQLGGADPYNLSSVCLIVDVRGMAETTVDRQRNGLGVPEEVGNQKDTLQPPRRPADRNRGSAESADEDSACLGRFLSLQRQYLLKLETHVGK